MPGLTDHGCEMLLDVFFGEAGTAFALEHLVSEGQLYQDVAPEEPDTLCSGDVALYSFILCS